MYSFATFGRDREDEDMMPDIDVSRMEQSLAGLALEAGKSQ